MYGHGARATELSGAGSLSAAAQLDSNPARLFGSSTVSDEGMALTGAVNGLLPGDSYRAAAEYDVGGRVFLPSDALQAQIDASADSSQGTMRTPNSLTQQLVVEAVKDLGTSWDVGVHGAARDRRGNHAYTDLKGGADASVRLGSHVSLLLDVVMERFLFYEAFPYSFYGPFTQGLVRFQLSRHHGWTVDGTYQPRVYNGCALHGADPNTRTCTEQRRRDMVASVGAGYHYRGPFQLDAEYRFTRQGSNSEGESNMQHRLVVASGFRLPWEVFAMVQGVLQLTHYPQGLTVNNSLLQEDDENASSVSLKLVKPVSRRVDLELRYAFYGAQLSEFPYQRHLLSFGCRYTF